MKKGSGVNPEPFCFVSQGSGPAMSLVATLDYMPETLGIFTYSSSEEDVSNEEVMTSLLSTEREPFQGFALVGSVVTPMM